MSTDATGGAIALIDNALYTLDLMARPPGEIVVPSRETVESLQVDLKASKRVLRERESAL